MHRISLFLIFIMTLCCNTLCAQRHTLAWGINTHFVADKHLRSDVLNVYYNQVYSYRLDRKVKNKVGGTFAYYFHSKPKKWTTRVGAEIVYFQQELYNEYNLFIDFL